MSDKNLEGLIGALEHVYATLGRKPTREERWFIQQARAYLAGEFATIDEALGLPDDVHRTLHELLGLDQHCSLASTRLGRRPENPVPQPGPPRHRNTKPTPKGRTAAPPKRPRQRR